MPKRILAWVAGLKYNLRFYILMATLLSSVAILAWQRQQIASDQLFYIRSQQIFGLLSVLLVYFAVILTPLSKLVRKKERLSNVLFARRAIGVSAAYFAFLHVYISFVGQAGGFSGIPLLPDRFKVAFALGLTAFVILFLMAITSFDKAIELLTFKRWKLLHRFVYASGVLIIVHVWMIGTHVVQTPYKITAVIMLAVLFALESIRIARMLGAKFKLATSETNILGLALFTVMMTAIVALPGLVTNYHSSHQADHEQGSQHD